jgi:DUF1680 family protein
MTFSLPIRLLSPHPQTHQDTLTISRGPIVYTAESIDNTTLDNAHPHFEGVGITSTVQFEEEELEIEGIPMISLKTKGEGVFVLEDVDREGGFAVVQGGEKVRKWKKVEEGLRFVPWFARANRGGEGRVRTAFLRADEALMK